MHPEVTAAWERIIEEWEDPARHATLLGLVARHNAFAWAAARYKERAGDPIAEQQLDRLRRAATATLLVTASTPSRAEAQPYRRTLIVLIVMLVMVGLGLLAVSALRDRGATSPSRTTPARH